VLCSSVKSDSDEQHRHRLKVGTIRKQEGFMTKGLVISAALLLVVSLPRHAKASTFDFSFSGAGVSGTVALTYGLAADGKYSDGFDITAISGTFSDSNIGIFNASIGPLVAISPTAPDPTNLLAPDVSVNSR
jgi:hypothetical protein